MMGALPRKTKTKTKTKIKTKNISSLGGVVDKGDLTQYWELRLYVAGTTNRAITAFQNLKKICEEHLKGKYRIEVIDLLEKPQLAQGDQIFATPTLVRKLPEPIKKIIGDLSNTEKVLVGLDVRPVK